MSLLTILCGGVEACVHLRDGTTEIVKVRQLPIRLYDGYARLQGDEAALVEFFVEKSQGWADSIELTSHELILRLGEELNSDPFARWAERRAAAMQKILTQVGPLNAPVTKPTAPTTPAPVASPLATSVSGSVPSAATPPTR